MKTKIILLLFVFFTMISFSQEEVEYKNKGSLGGRAYGRGNGVSLMYDRELNSYFSVGAGIELYFIGRGKRGVVLPFSIFDFHLKKP